MSRKGLLSLLLATLILLTCLGAVGCSPDTRSDARLSVVCSVFPEYDWLKNIVGDVEGVSLTLLVKNGRELHGYDATPAEIVMLKQSDIVISVGGVSDVWISDALSADAQSTEHIRLSQIDGMSSYTSSGHHHEDGHDHSADTPDEHLWLSPSNAAVACRYICERLCAADPQGADAYRSNTQRYLAELDALEGELVSLAGSLDGKTLVFADRFPFVYMLEPYGIKYHSAVEGCSTDIGWTPQTTVEMTQLVNSLASPCVFVTETSDGELARLIIESSDDTSRTVVTLNSMQSVTQKDTENLSYVSIMRANINAIKQGFSIN